MLLIFLRAYVNTHTPLVNVDFHRFVLALMRVVTVSYCHSDLDAVFLTLICQIHTTFRWTMPTMTRWHEPLRLSSVLSFFPH